ncbi:OadG family protein [bacterium]|nr:OadG family protein [bacterium]
MMSKILEEGLVIMCTGMGVVFSFLIILIFSMLIMANIMKFLNKLFPEAVPEQSKSSKPKRLGKDEEEIAIAIALATRGI